MPSEEELIENRRAKHEEVNGGEYPLEGFCPTIISIRKMMELLGDLKTSIDPVELGDDYLWKIHGRVVALRKSGAITFIKVADASDAIQVIVSRASFADYDKLRLIDLGDIIHVDGRACLSKTGEYSLLMDRWSMVTKAHRPPPEKFAGVVDQELKYRKRYLDLMSNEETRARFKIRSLAIRAIREFMELKNFMEVETSTLTSIRSGANARPFTTHHNAMEADLYLRIAPELYLKRLLVGGYERVFEIGRNYRNEGVSTRHNPEFTMIESYQAYGTFNELVADTKSLLVYIDSYIAEKVEPWVAPHLQKYLEERTFSLKAHDFKEMPMHGAVLLACQRAGLTLNFSVQEQSFHLEVRELGNPRLQKIDVAGMYHDLNNCGMVGEKLYVLFEHVAEPFLTEDYRSADGTKSAPVFITKYPKEVSPLARSCDNNPYFCDRFELFIDGRELANAFQELNDPDEQARRFIDQLESNLEKEAMDFDHDYVEALEQGMPPAIGFGMGIDRLVMLLTNAPTIKDVILFPTLKPLK